MGRAVAQRIFVASVITVAAFSAARADHRGALEAYYPFDRVTSPTMDRAHQHHGFLKGSVRFVHGKNSVRTSVAPSGRNLNALIFDGGDGAVEIKDHEKLRLDASFTLSGWIKLSKQKTQHILISKDKPGWPYLTNYTLSVRDGRLQIEITFNAPNVKIFRLSRGAFVCNGAPSNCTLRAITAIKTGGWYHIAATFEAKSKTLKLYVNGKRDGDVRLAVSSGENALVNNESLLLGRRNDKGFAYAALHGTLDEVCIWRRTLSADELIRVQKYGCRAGISGINRASVDKRGWAGKCVYACKCACACGGKATGKVNGMKVRVITCRKIVVVKKTFAQSFHRESEVVRDREFHRGELSHSSVNSHRSNSSHSAAASHDTSNSHLKSGSHNSRASHDSSWSHNSAQSHYKNASKHSRYESHSKRGSKHDQWKSHSKRGSKHDSRKSHSKRGSKHDQWKSHGKRGSKHDRWKSHSKRGSKHDRWKSHSKRGSKHDQWKSHGKRGSRHDSRKSHSKSGSRHDQWKSHGKRGSSHNAHRSHGKNGSRHAASQSHSKYGSHRKSNSRPGNGHKAKPYQKKHDVKRKRRKDPHGKAYNKRHNGKVSIRHGRGKYKKSSGRPHHPGLKRGHKSKRPTHRGTVKAYHKRRGGKVTLHHGRGKHKKSAKYLRHPGKKFGYKAKRPKHRGGNPRHKSRPYSRSEKAVVVRPYRRGNKVGRGSYRNGSRYTTGHRSRPGSRANKRRGGYNNRSVYKRSRPATIIRPHRPTKSRSYRRSSKPRGAYRESVRSGQNIYSRRKSGRPTVIRPYRLNRYRPSGGASSGRSSISPRSYGRPSVSRRSNRSYSRSRSSSGRSYSRSSGRSRNRR